MAAPPGAMVRLSPFDMAEGYDAPGPEKGDVLLSKAGSVYLILHSRATKRPGRYSLQCLALGRLGLEGIPPGKRILGFTWNPRRRRTVSRHNTGRE